MSLRWKLQCHNDPLIKALSPNMQTFCQTWKHETELSVRQSVGQDRKGLQGVVQCHRERVLFSIIL